jgi:hypothetical protein
MCRHRDRVNARRMRIFSSVILLAACIALVLYLLIPVFRTGIGDSLRNRKRSTIDAGTLPQEARRSALQKMPVSPPVTPARKRGSPGLSQRRALPRAGVDSSACHPFALDVSHRLARRMACLDPGHCRAVRRHDDAVSVPRPNRRALFRRAPAASFHPKSGSCRAPIGGLRLPGRPASGG